MKHQGKIQSGKDAISQIQFKKKSLFKLMLCIS